MKKISNDLIDAVVLLLTAYSVSTDDHRLQNQITQLRHELRTLPYARVDMPMKAKEVEYLKTELHKHMKDEFKIGFEVGLAFLGYRGIGLESYTRDILCSEEYLKL